MAGERSVETVSRRSLITGLVFGGIIVAETGFIGYKLLEKDPEPAKFVIITPNEEDSSAAFTQNIDAILRSAQSANKLNVNTKGKQTDYDISFTVKNTQIEMEGLETVTYEVYKIRHDDFSLRNLNVTGKLGPHTIAVFGAEQNDNDGKTNLARKWSGSTQVSWQKINQAMSQDFNRFAQASNANSLVA